MTNDEPHLENKTPQRASSQDSISGTAQSPAAKHSVAPDEAQLKQDVSKDKFVVELISFLRDYLLLPEVRSRPDFIANNKELEDLVENLTYLREVLYAFSKGNLLGDVKLKGFMAGCIKQLQAHLRHLMWQADQIASGDFTQKVDFLGPLAEAFNGMSTRIAQLIRELQEKETVLLQLTDELKKEIEMRKQKELELQQSQERWRLAFACSMDGVWDMDLKTGSTYCSPRFLEILRVTPSSSSPVDFDWEQWLHPGDTEVRQVILDMLHGGEVPDRLLEHRFYCGDGQYRWMGTRCMLIRDEHGIPSRLIGVTEDAQDRHMREAALSKQATHDNLTGLPNRYLYTDRLHQYAAMAKRRHSALVLLVLDLDGFKTINDTLGHYVGDCVLKKIAEQLLVSVRETDTVSRFGGDEFLVLLPCELGQEFQVANRAIVSLFSAFEQKVTIASCEVKVGLSAGAACYPKDTTDLDLLFRYADEALYAAKKAGKGRLVMWDAVVKTEVS